MDGGGSDAPQRAIDLRTLGYGVCFLGDSDRELVPGPEAMRTAGLYVLIWADGKATEERVMCDLPWAGVLEVLALAVDERSEQSVRDSIKSRLGNDVALIQGAFHEWRDSEPLRQAISLAAKNTNWFKRIDTGQRLGDVICRHMEAIAETDLGRKITALRLWVDGEND